MTIKFAISGCHGNGKTTLCKKMQKVFEFFDKSVYLVKESARECPYTISEHTTIQSQQWIWKKHLQFELDAEKSNSDIIICDRTLMDNLIYYKYLLNGKNDPIYNVFLDFTKKWMKTYKYISVLPLIPEFMKDDGVRITDIKMTYKINDLFMKYIKPYQNININRFNYKEIVKNIIYND